MKYIIAVIQPHRLEAVREALAGIGVQGMTVTEVQGFGRQKGQAEVLFKRNEFTVNLLRKVQLMIAVNDHFVEPTIVRVPGTGKRGSGLGLNIVRDVVAARAAAVALQRDLERELAELSRQMAELSQRAHQHPELDTSFQSAYRDVQNRLSLCEECRSLL